MTSWWGSRWNRRFSVRVGVVLAVLCIALVSAIALQPRRGAVSALCSNNANSCDSVAAAYERWTGQRVDLIRLPTSEALTRLTASASDPEFDIWLGGPAEAYVTAARQGLLAPMNTLPNFESIPASLRDTEGYWAGVYGGILALCVASDQLDAVPHSWEELASSSYRGSVIAPNPILSGTAATMVWVQYTRVGSVAGAMDYMRLLDRNIVLYTDSGTSPARLVASGKAPIGITFAPYCDYERQAGYDVVTVFPFDGTGYEIGAVGIVAGAPHQDAAEAFADFSMSVAGQKAGSEPSLQLPTSQALPGNLTAALDALDVPIMNRSTEAAASLRATLMYRWAKDVRDGAY